MPYSEVSASCDYCETYCQLCESCQSCETFCQDSCQTACESACQSTCQLGCQSGCEVASQSANHFEWDFCEVSAASNTTDTAARMRPPSSMCLIRMSVIFMERPPL